MKPRRSEDGCDWLLHVRESVLSVVPWSAYHFITSCQVVGLLQLVATRASAAMIGVGSTCGQWWRLVTTSRERRASVMDDEALPTRVILFFSDGSFRCVRTHSSTVVLTEGEPCLVPQRLSLHTSTRTERLNCSLNPCFEMAPHNAHTHSAHSHSHTYPSHVTHGLAHSSRLQRCFCAIAAPT